MRANHLVTFGLCIGTAATAACFVGCGTDTSGTCSDTNTCAAFQGDASIDQVSGDDAPDGDDGSMGSDATDGGGGDDASDGGGGMDAGDAGVQCDSGTDIVCNGVCVSASDPGHCGSCSNVCPGPSAGMGMAQCTLAADGGGVCSVQCGGATSEQCGGSCFDPHDLNNCGTCGNVCQPPSGGNGSATCTGSPATCGIACNANYNSCNGQCLPDSSDPSADPCIVSDTFGVFVSPLGHAGAAGTKADPLNTISAGIAQAAMGTQKRVFVCAGTYAEQIAPASSADGVSVYGGLDCTNWSYASSNTVKVAPATQGYALNVTGMTTGETFEDIEFDAQGAPQSPPTSGAGQSSIAVFASGSKLTLTRVTVVAGNAQPGAPGIAFSNWSTTASTGQDGTTLTGGAGGTNTCPDGLTGGATSSSGGTGAILGGADATSGGAQPSVGNPNWGGSGPICGGGGPGASGLASNSPASGATSSGSLVSAGWKPGPAGSDGLTANPGQGGGGGGASPGVNGGSGGGGGAGGCGGGKGGGGATGGSSIGIVSYQSSLVLSSLTITAHAAGGGGAGAAGQSGQNGGTGGAGGGKAACSGGTGGIGGGGGGGGGGAGGLSAGIVWSGTTPPNIDGTPEAGATTLPGVISLGAAGAAGLGGSGGQAIGGNPGASGAVGAPGQQVAILQN